MRRVFIKTVLILLMFFVNISVKASGCIEANNIIGATSGTLGAISESCGGYNCANTLGLKVGGYTFKNTAIYGVRLTIMVNNQEKEVKNFWATESMVNAVNSKDITRLGKTTKSYGNYYVNGNLYNYTNSSNYNLRQIDYDNSATYSQFAKDSDKGLSNEQRLNKYLSKFSKKYSTVEKLASMDNVKIKVEPIYALHHYGKSVGEYFYAGTSKEILSKRSAHGLSAVTSLSGWKVIKNYLKTIYTSKPSGDSNDDWYSKAGSTAGVGYLVFNKVSCSYSSVKLIKKQSTKSSSQNVDRSGDNFSGCASFKIKKKDGSAFKDVTKSITGKKTVEVGNGCSAKKNSITLDKFPSGTYKLVESNAKNAVVSEIYSKTTIDSSTKTNTGKESNQFKIVNGKKSDVEVTFVNKTEATEYTIVASVRQLKYIDDWDLVQIVPKPGEYYFQKEFDSSKAVCKTSESDPSKSKYQCYKLCKRKADGTCEDLSNSIGSLANYRGTVTLILEKYNGSTWNEVSGSRKTVDYDGSFNSVFWNVKASGTYRVRQVGCNNCGNGKTYIKTQKYKTSSGKGMKGNFRRKLESTAFYVGKYKDSNGNTGYTGRSASGANYFGADGTYYNVWIANRLDDSCVGADCCASDLQTIKNKAYSDVKTLKIDLINLYSKYSSMNNLLNFTPSDNDVNTIKSKVSCSVHEKQKINKSCESTTLGFTTDVKDTPLSAYSKSDLAKTIYDTDDKLLCYINYKIDFNEEDVIKDNTYLYNKSFLWPNVLSDKVGTLTAQLHCEGVINPEDADYYENKDVKDTMLSFISKIKIKDSSDKTLQVLSFKKELTNSDYNVKNQDESDENGEDSETFDDYEIYDGSINNSTDSYGIIDSENNDNDYFGNNIYDDTADVSENIVDGNYITINQTISSNIIYDRYYYADYLSGTASETVSQGNMYKLGWGVPVDMKSSGDTLKFKYIFDENSNIYNFYNSTFENFDDNFSSTCSYTRSSNDSKVRFIDTNTPFPGKTATTYSSVRETGKNWNICYTTILNRIGQLSNKSNCDMLGNCSASDLTSKKNLYCMYGDANCDGRFNDYTTQYNNAISIELADVNRDGFVNSFDSRLVSAWYKIHIMNENIDLNSFCSEYSNDYNVATSKEEDILVTQYIKNSSSSSSTNEPLYSFTLSSKDLQNIRNYNFDVSTNSKKSYLDSDNFSCNTNGVCFSQFITDLLTTSNGLTTTNKGGKCTSSEYITSSDNQKRKICRN